MAKYRKITIKWSNPIEINSILEKDAVNDIGVYFITNKRRGKQKPLYIRKKKRFGRIICVGNIRHNKSNA